MAVIDRNSPLPLYFQLKQMVLSKIQNAEWSPGEMIPSEQEFQDTYNLSRTTVRQTLTELVAEGYLVRQRGRGTFIAKPKVTYDPTKSLALNDFVSQQGLDFGWRLVDHDWLMEVPSEVRVALKLADVERVYRIRRIRVADDELIGYHIAYLPEITQKYIDENALTVGRSLDYLMSYPGLRAAKIQRTLEASLANAQDEFLLDIDPGKPILNLKRVVIGADDTPLEFLSARFRGDRFKYSITL